MQVIRWGILGAAKFAREHIGPAIHMAKGAELAALATSDPGKAVPFQAFAPQVRVHDSYDALLADPGIDAIYIPLPNHMHVDWSLKALDAGKHVLCEKPMTLKAAELDRLIAARDESGLLAAEAYMITHHPQMTRARDLIADGAIGDLRHVDACFTYFNDDASNIRNYSAMGGGGLRDVGVYTLGGARFVTGQEPEKITLVNLAYENDVDTFAQVSARFPGFSDSAIVSMRMHPRQAMVIHGMGGVLTLTCPFNPTALDSATLRLENSRHSVTVERWPGVNQYVLQVENFGRTIADGTPYPCPLEFSKGTQKMIDMVFAAA